MLADVMKSQRKMSEAAKYYRIALKGRSLLFGQTHPDTLDVVHSLGNLLLRRKNTRDEAEELFNDWLDLCEHELGAGHAATLRMVNNLALVLKKLRQLERAKELFQRAAQGREALFGFDDAAVLQSYTNLANCLRDLKQYDEAEPLYRKIIESKTQLLGSEHESTLLTLYQFATLL